jgi:hypothetical protein
MKSDERLPTCPLWPNNESVLLPPAEVNATGGDGLGDCLLRLVVSELSPFV